MLANFLVSASPGWINADQIEPFGGLFRELIIKTTGTE
jgi:hypothetical protein